MVNHHYFCHMSNLACSDWLKYVIFFFNIMAESSHKFQRQKVLFFSFNFLEKKDAFFFLFKFLKKLFCFSNFRKKTYFNVKNTNSKKKLFENPYNFFFFTLVAFFVGLFHYHKPAHILQMASSHSQHYIYCIVFVYYVVYFQMSETVFISLFVHTFSIIYVLHIHFCYSYRLLI